MEHRDEDSFGVNPQTWSCWVRGRVSYSCDGVSGAHCRGCPGPHAHLQQTFPVSTRTIQGTFSGFPTFASLTGENKQLSVSYVEGEGVTARMLWAA